MDPITLVRTLLGVTLLAVIATSTLSAFGAPRVWEPAVAIARGLLQLAAISIILTGLITHPLWIGLALAIMLSVAIAVAAGRIGWSRRNVRLLTGPIAAGAFTAAGSVFLTGALELSARYALAIGSIVIGGAMSTATLTARLLTSAMIDHWDEVEGWLALGATPRTSTIRLARQVVHDALVPAIDQTKTTGLVVLPGAFVGAIFAGLSPVEAGRFQIVVLAALMAGGAVTAVLTALALGNIRHKPTPI